MTSNAPKFRLLHLPRLALANVLQNFNDGNLFMFSLCSKRCSLVVKSFRHGFTGIQVILSCNAVCFILSDKDIQQESFVIRKGVQSNVFRVLIIDGRPIWMRKGSPNTRSIFNKGNWALDVKALVDHLVETFQVHFETVSFFLDDFHNYRDFIQYFPKCDYLKICRDWPLSEKDITHIKEHVEYKNFYINRNLQ